MYLLITYLYHCRTFSDVLKTGGRSLISKFQIYVLYIIRRACVQLTVRAAILECSELLRIGNNNLSSATSQ